LQINDQGLTAETQMQTDNRSKFFRLINISRYWLLCFALLASGSWWFWRSLPEPLFSVPLSLVIEDRRGELLGAHIAADEQWRFPPLTDVSQKLTQAIVLFEDKRFFNHLGVDPLAVARAIKLNLSNGGIVSGASTITMQVIRLARSNQPRTFLEKLIESFLALRLELGYSKDEILAMYAAHAPFGGNVVGVEAAAWRYFQRPPERLSWAESSMLAVLPNNPALIHPGRNREALKLKRDRLLLRLHEAGSLDTLSYSLAVDEPLPKKPKPLPRLAPHLLTGFQNQLYGARISGSTKPDSRFRTTIDGELQEQLQQIINRFTESYGRSNIHNGAAIILSTKSGAALGYCGNITIGNDHGEAVDVIQARRSTGSLLKPILYAGMLENGKTLPTTLIPDVPTHFAGYSPQNFSGQFMGAVDAQTVVMRSLNVPAVRMLRRYGQKRFYRLLKQLGLNSINRNPEHYGLSLILGGAESSLWELTGMYAGLARCAMKHETAFYPPHVLLSDSRSVGSPLSPFSSAACWLTLEAMVNVSRPGGEFSWKKYSSAQSIAWKTGTSWGHRDAWAIGVTPEYTVGVWIGNADGEGRPELVGLSHAAPVLFEIYSLLRDNSRWFEMPTEELSALSICAQSGYLPGMNCPDIQEILAPQGSQSMQVCPYHRSIQLDPDKHRRVHSGCESVARMENMDWFVLPPDMEKYYAPEHADYYMLPPYRKDCQDCLEQNQNMILNYPSSGLELYIPIELSGESGKIICSATHRNNQGTIYWHLDSQYLGSTKRFHQIGIQPDPGKHQLLLIDEQGQRVECGFYVLSGNE
jgi:penicillin-binding protein 1C